MPARQWWLRGACGLSRVNGFLALWSQAYLPSCNRQVTPASVHMECPAWHAYQPFRLKGLSGLGAAAWLCGQAAAYGLSRGSQAAPYLS